MLARVQREYEKMNFDGHYAIGVEWFQGRVRQLEHEAEKQIAEESRRAEQRRHARRELPAPWPQEVLDFYRASADADAAAHPEAYAERLAEILAVA
jgi:hypothetical protein